MDLPQGFFGSAPKPPAREAMGPHVWALLLPGSQTEAGPLWSRPPAGFPDNKAVVFMEMNLPWSSVSAAAFIR